MSKPALASSPTARIIELTWGYAPTLIAEAAIRLGVFDILDAGPLDLNGICERTKSSERGMGALLNALAALDLVRKDASGLFTLDPVSKALLVSSKPDFQGGLLSNTSRSILPVWFGLTEAVRTGRPQSAANQESGGAEFFSNSVLDLFPLSYPSTQVLAWALRLSSATGPVRVLDVAAGSGVWGIGLAKAARQVNVVAVDWEKVLAVTRRTAEAYGVADRFTLVAGDIHEAPFGENFDVAVLGGILHSEGEAGSKALIARVFAALKPGGIIAISEFLVNDPHTGPLMGTVFAVVMLLHTEAGGTFSPTEIGGWLTDAGFEDVRLLKVPAPSPLVLATRPAVPPQQQLHCHE